ncbi:hypothetical protein [Paenibacillus cineris]|uniref:hypothetical protein n=1 Tax=Paenibacillus cineris TaxID=237530 RepID=UPI001BB2F1E3|nr:hypothetical protein [Paenibacillus cineris]
MNKANSTTLTSAAPAPSKPMVRWWRRWPEWIHYATMAWMFVYGALGLFWALGGSGFPLGLLGDPTADHSLFRQAVSATGGTLIACFSFIGMTALIFSNRRGAVRVIRLLYGWSAAAILCFAIPDPRALMGVAYAPVSLIAFLSGQSLHYLAFFTWPVVHQYICLLGGLLWAASTLTWYRRMHNACSYCGQKEGRTDHRISSAARWGTWATYAAILAPAYYDMTRIAWLLGIPFGISREMLHDLQVSGADWAGAGLALVSMGGAYLTHGLIRPWGEVFPRWFPLCGGRRVPPLLAVVPAGFVAILLTVTGIQVIFEFMWSGDFENWGGTTPLLLLPLWGIALGAAAISYYKRRQGHCRHCSEADHP